MEDVIYIIRYKGFMGDVWEASNEKPNLSRYFSEGTEIYEAKLIAKYRSVNIIKEDVTSPS